MTGRIRGLWPRPVALVQLTALHAAAALLQGLLLATLVPVFRALLRTDPDFPAATPWLVTGGVGAVLYVFVSLATSPVTFAATTVLSAQLRHRLMRHATGLPVGWFDTENKGRLSRTVTTAATAVTHLAVLFGPAVIAGTIVPATVIAVAFVVEWRITAVLLAVAPLAYLTRRRGTRITAQADIALERVAGEIATRAIELAHAQPVLRATGTATTGTAAMAQAITEHERTYRSGMRRVQAPELLFRSLLAAGLLVALVVGTRLMVFQHVYLFDDTIEANVRLGRPEATHEELAQAAAAARLDEVIERLPGGWQTRVGEGGAQLSGGERQRVSIARALLKDSRVVLIDEAASALDPANAAAVGQATGALAAQGRTVIVIAHQPATLVTADRAVVLDAGRVVQTGTPGELLAVDGPFARLYHQHERARAWRLTTTRERESPTSC